MSGKCPNCGMALNEDWNYCPNCNTRVYLRPSEYVNNEIIAGKSVIRIPASMLKKAGKIERDEIRDLCTINEVKLIVVQD